MNLPEFAIKKPVTIIVIMLIFFTIGIISITKLPLEMMPDISFPGLSVQIPYPSSSPEEVERIITRPVEEILSTVNNLDTISSTSSNSSSNISMQFSSGTNMDVATMEIRDKLDLVRDKLPDDLQNIRINRRGMNDRPVINFSLSMPGDKQTLNYWAENFITQELERIEGVASVDIRGLRNKVMTIFLKPEVFYSSSIRIEDLINNIRNNNINISAGYVEDDNLRYVTRIPGELKVLEEIKNLPVNNQGLSIADVAVVTYDFPIQEQFNRLDGNETVRFQIFRASNANIVEVCNAVKDTMVRIQKTKPELEKMLTIFYMDQSADILRSLKDLTISGILGGLMAVLVLIFFLRKFRSTIIISIAIPMAIVFTFSLMYLYKAVFGADVTINIISLSGLMMSVGMLLDNSVVVLENIFRLRQEKKYSPLEASTKGSSEVALAVTASTLTTLVVFVSMGFMSRSGFGRYMQDFALTISLALIASLMVALTFIPLASSRLLAGKAKEKAGWLIKMTNLYEKIIRLTIKNWKTKLVIVGIALAFMGSAAILFKNLEREMMPRSSEREIQLSVYMPRSFTLNQMKSLFTSYEELLLPRKEELGIEHMTVEFGVQSARQGRFQGRIELNLTDDGPSVEEIKEELKKLLPQRAGITYEYGQRFGRGGGSMGVSVELIGLDYTTLTELAPIVMEKMRTVKDVEDVTSDLEGGSTQLMIQVDRKKAENSGVNSRMIAQTISSSVSERPIGQFKMDNREVDIILKIQGDEGFSETDLRNLSIQIQDKRIPISAISDFSYGIGSTSIRKENKKTKLIIRVNTKSQGMMGITDNIRTAMETIPFPEGYTWSLGGGFRQFQESQGESNLAIVLALIFIYIIMASLFESFVHPFTILFTVPLALFGVSAFFFITHITLNTSSYLGLLTLFGIVVNNGIILIDHIRNLRKSGMAKNAAIIQGGKDRMRPIIMTAITTMIGVLPLALPLIFPNAFPAVSRRAQMWAPIAVAIIGGLTTSTFFTLIILPTFYSISDSVTTAVKTRLGFKNVQI
ncbi:MAG: efflux RND transporter permease subunit [Candidatus Aminicenantes bacterium]|nr:efflux RND transporter permease subunit [Candidatus Aminicenantes bacterium]